MLLTRYFITPSYLHWWECKVIVSGVVHRFISLLICHYANNMHSTLFPMAFFRCKNCKRMATTQKNNTNYISLSDCSSFEPSSSLDSSDFDILEEDETPYYNLLFIPENDVVHDSMFDTVQLPAEDPSTIPEIVMCSHRGCHFFAQTPNEIEHHELDEHSHLNHILEMPSLGCMSLLYPTPFQINVQNAQSYWNQIGGISVRH